MNRKQFLKLIVLLPFVAKGLAQNKKLIVSMDPARGPDISVMQEGIILPDGTVQMIGNPRYSFDVGPKYEWITGPFATADSLHPTYGREFIQTMIWGQVRNRRSGKTSDWCRMFNAAYKTEMRDHLDQMWPRAADWSEHLKSTTDEQERGPGLFDLGILRHGASDHRLS